MLRWTGYLLHRVEQYASKLYHARMAQIGLRPGQVGILQLLANDGPHVQARLGERLQVDQAAVVHYLNELENGKLVERRNHPDDERAFLILLTPSGLERLQQAEQENAAISEELLRMLSHDEQIQLHSLLEKIVISRTDTSATARRSFPTAASSDGWCAG